MAQFVLKIEKLSHIMGPRASQDFRSPSPIMAPDPVEALSFIAQLEEHRTGIAEVTGSNTVKALIFSGFFFPIA